MNDVYWLSVLLGVNSIPKSGPGGATAEVSVEFTLTRMLLEDCLAAISAPAGRFNCTCNACVVRREQL